ncbi:hypothetical protein Tco_1349957 [Tanacetum coccineum]
MALSQTPGKAALNQVSFVKIVKKRDTIKVNIIKLVGYRVGHPLHGKFKPGNSGQNRTTNFKPRAVNMVTGYSVGQETNGGGEASTSGTKADDAVFAKMDSLQNQLNQVMLMLQNSQCMIDPKLLAAGRYLFIASCASIFKDAWVVDSGATDHICNALHLMYNIIQCTIPILVSLPNGHTVTVTTVGSVRVKPNLVLHNVFHIPSFAYNLLSGNNQKIAHGIQSDGLYIIKSEATSTPTSPKVSPTPATVYLIPATFGMLD